MIYGLTFYDLPNENIFLIFIPLKDITTDLATMEDDEGKDMAECKSMSANGMLGQSSPHRSDVFLDGVFSVLYPGFPHIFSH